ncbi:dihydrofolate reductase-like [Littorina saxatilis]|uniref:dihydrofolate reductase n=1 Tax=Littorina saxatilis TaxID=31220 RepID=A0AAN9AKE0_9CAEN
MSDKAEYDIVVAFLDKDQGFAFNNTFPWPYLPGDHKFYIDLTTSRKDQSKKNGYIMGRVTWEAWTEDEKSNPNLFTVVTSSTLKSDGVPHLQKVLPSLDDAITYITTPPVSDQLEKVWLMGGGRNYDASMDDPRLKRIWVTRIFGDFTANVFFPKFQDKFKRVKCPTLDESLQEDNGVKYQFELWERFTN